jgi:hypothetical protein
VVPSIVNHQMVVELKDVTVKINGAVIKLNGLGALLNGIMASTLKSYIGEIEKSFKESVAKEMGPSLASALAALAFNSDFEVDKPDGSGNKVKASLKTDFSSVDFNPEGGTFMLRVGAYAKKANTVDNLGVPARVGCGKGNQQVVLLKKKPLEISLADDSLNEIMYALWLGGLLEFPVPEALLGGVDLKKYGATDLEMKAKALLAPTLSDCNTKAEFDAFIGDLRIDAKLKLLGTPMTIVLYATFTAGTKVDAKGDKISVALTGVKKTYTEVTVLEDDLVGSEAAIEKMIAESLVGGLMQALGGQALGAFDLPKVDLSAAMKGLPKGTAIAIDPQTVTRKGGNSIIGGKLK